MIPVKSGRPLRPERSAPTALDYIPNSIYTNLIFLFLYQKGHADIVVKNKFLQSFLCIFLLNSNLYCS